MGDVKSKQDTNKTDIGLFAYDKGARTVFIDAETGKAEFGKTGSGQIVIDPRNNKAQLYSGNYDTKEGTGMLIDLTTPEIKFGSGHFSVNKDGNLIAEGGGKIAGWNIGYDALTSSTVNKTIKKEDGTESVSTTENYIPLKLGINEIVYKDKYGQDLFNVNSNGSANIAGWKFDNEKLQSPKGKLTLSNSTVVFKDSDGEEIFKADDTGAVKIGNWIAKSNQLTSSDGKIVLDPIGSTFSGNTTIGGWTVDNNSIKSKPDKNDENKQISINSDGSIQANYNSKDKTGWAINRDGTATFYQLNAQKGSIGGITIENNTLHDDGKHFVLGPSGCHFTGLTVTNNGVGVGNSGGASYGGGSGITGPGGSWGGSGGHMGPLSWGSNGSGQIEKEKTKIAVNGKTYEFDTYIKSLVVDQLAVTNLFMYQNRIAHWEAQPFVSKLSLSADKRFLEVYIRQSIVLQTDLINGVQQTGYTLGPLGGN